MNQDKFNSKVFTSIIAIILISFLSNCAGIVGNNVDLKDYPEPKREEIDKLDLEFKPYNSRIMYEAKKLGYETKLKKGDKANAKCLVDYKMGDYNTFFGCPIITNLIAPFTLFIIPFYCQQTYSSGATLIETKTNKILKTYYLKDKVHEVWSSLWMLNPLSWDENSPEGATNKMKIKLSQALTRQIINDAKNFKECQK